MIITIKGSGLTLDAIAAVARGEVVRLTDDPAVLGRISKSRDVLRQKIAKGEQIYGVTTLFGGMADQSAGAQYLVDIQRSALSHHKSTTGPRLAAGDVRAAMLLRANSLMKGASGIRLEIIERFVTFLNAANLAREQLDVLEHYLAAALICAVQAVELRAKLVSDTYDARAVLSPATQRLYVQARTAASGPPDESRPLHWNDLDEFLQPKVEGLLADIARRGGVFDSIADVCRSLRKRRTGVTPATNG